MHHLLHSKDEDIDLRLGFQCNRYVSMHRWLFSSRVTDTD